MTWVGKNGIGRISLVVPTYSANDKLTDMAIACVESYLPQVDEVIVAEDSDIFNQRLHDLADVYIMHPNVGYSANTNMAWKLATGDFALVVNSDTTLASGNIKDLCKPWTLCSPHMIENSSHSNANVSGACFCVPRDVYKEDKFDEHYPFANADTALFARYKDMKVNFEVINTVSVNHISGTPGPSLRAKK